MGACKRMKPDEEYTEDDLAAECKHFVVKTAVAQLNIWTELAATFYLMVFLLLDTYLTIEVGMGSEFAIAANNVVCHAADWPDPLCRQKRFTLIVAYLIL